MAPEATSEASRASPSACRSVKKMCSRVGKTHGLSESSARALDEFKSQDSTLGPIRSSCSSRNHGPSAVGSVGLFAVLRGMGCTALIPSVSSYAVTRRARLCNNAATRCTCHMVTSLVTRNSSRAASPLEPNCNNLVITEAQVCAIAEMAVDDLLDLRQGQGPELAGENASAAMCLLAMNLVQALRDLVMPRWPA